MESWLWLIAWTVLMYVIWVYLYRQWKTKRRQRQEYLWQQIGFHPDLSHQAGKTGIAIEQKTRRVALRDQNNLGVFEPGDIVSFRKSMLPAGSSRHHYLDLHIRDPRKPDWRIDFEQDTRGWDAVYAQLCSLLPDKEAPQEG